MPRRCHLREVHRNAAQLDARGEALQQSAGQHQQRREEAERAVARHEGDQDRPHRHDRERYDESAPPAHAVDVGSQNDRTKRAHQKPCAEHRKGQ